jgi:hypothetical protein
MNKSGKDNVNPVFDAIQAIKENNPELKKEENTGIVDIITFCDDPRYLNLLDKTTNNLDLFLPQRIILKCFYKDTIGNENLKLTEKEWEWLYENEENEERDGSEYEKNIKDVIRKILEKEKNSEATPFTQLQLVLGRRSGKTLLASVITAYEVYKLLVINNGDPHGYYNLPADDEIVIINVALSQQQAGRLFGQAVTRLRNSPFFKDRIAKETSSEIRLYTDGDLRKKRMGTNLSIPGSILILCGHSNPDSLAGYNAIMILFDEIAFYDETGKVTGKYFYNRLKPSLSKFFKFHAGKIVQISSPNAKLGIFYETFVDSKEDDSILSFQLPTWCINSDISYEEKELQNSRKSNPEQFAIEYGAQWAGGGRYGNYFEEELITRCVRGDLEPHYRPNPKYNYFLHVDPAKKGNNYSAVLIAKERYTNHLGHKRNRCILANLWVWRPLPGKGLQFHLIDKDMIVICKTFHPSLVTYDDYHSIHSLQLLKSHGVNTRQMSYNRNVKMKIYQNLRDLMSYEPTPELWLYNNGGESNLLIGEMQNLKFKESKRGYTLMTDKHADVKTDDLLDALAGACSSACEGLRMALPEPVTVRMGHF